MFWPEMLPRVAGGVQGVPVTHGFAAVPNLSLVAPPAMPDARPKLSTPLLDALARVGAVVTLLIHRLA